MSRKITVAEPARVLEEDVAVTFEQLVQDNSRVRRWHPLTATMMLQFTII